MTKKICYTVAVAFLAGILSSAMPRAWAQATAEKNTAEKNAPEKSVTEKKAPERKATGTYRLEFRITELEGEKKINARAYSLLMTGDRSTLKAGTRVPIQSASETPVKQFQYFDVGQNITSWGLFENDHGISVSMDIEFNNFALPEQATAIPAGYPPPMVRQFHAQTTTALELGRPTVISTLDDPSSKRTFQIEVTATRVREKE